MTPLLRGGAVMARVIFALALRETRTRFGAHQLGYLWALLEPLFWVLTFYGMFALIDREAPLGMEIIPFLATGVIPYELSVRTADRVSASIDGNKALLFYPHVQPLDLVLARGALELATYLMVALIILGGYALATQTFAIQSILNVLLGMSLAALLGMTLGTVLCSISVVNNSVHRIKGPVFRPLFWISGLFFTANMLPTRVRELAMYNPILHCVEIVRDGWFESYHAKHASPGYVLVWIVALAFVGLTLERKVRARIQLT